MTFVQTKNAAGRRRPSFRRSIAACCWVGEGKCVELDVDYQYAQAVHSM
jgi:hypothetical protein